MRSISAAAKRAEREYQRQQRLLEKRQKLLNKMLVEEQARLEVEEFDENLKRLISVHKECGEEFDWEDVLSMPKPEEPFKLTPNETKALALLNNYKPSLIDRIFCRIKEKEQQLRIDYVRAQQIDEQNYRNDYNRYQQSVDAWVKNCRYAEEILNGQMQVYSEVVADIQPFIEIEELGCQLNYVAHTPYLVEVALKVSSDQIVPEETKSFTASHKVSTKKLPKAKFFEIYQDYVCSCTLRVGRELQAILPIKTVLINTYSEMLNQQTGYQEITAILGVVMPRETMQKLNFHALEPSEAMRNFINRMSFKKTGGFEQINVLTVQEIPETLL